jgi:NAD-dependent dihydropyrimidine dehydrogenase PreA subunit
MTTKDEPVKRKRIRNPMFSEREQDYLERADEFREHVFSATENALGEGFEYFMTESSLSFERPPDGFSVDNAGSTEIMKVRNIPKRMMPGMLGIIRNLQKGKKESWADIEQYLDDLEPTPFEPKPVLWDDIKKYVNKKWNDVFIGFTELPLEMIFKGKFTLFKYALVVCQEMKKDKIDHAPDFKAGKEVMRVYSSLGLVVNDIARWLRKKGVRCQSNHPLGGLVNTPSLAGKAGMGWIGRNGLLITPEYGPRQRIAPVFIEHKYFEFTDNRDYDWITDYCALCERCVKECPGQAIYPESVVSIDSVPGIGTMQTCIDRDKCFPFFSETLGCSVCVKVCPFSKAGDTYDRLKAVVDKSDD